MFISNLWFFKDGEKYFSLNMLHQQLKFVPPSTKYQFGLSAIGISELL